MKAKLIKLINQIEDEDTLYLIFQISQYFYVHRT